MACCLNTRQYHTWGSSTRRGSGPYVRGSVVAYVQGLKTAGWCTYSRLVDGLVHVQRLKKAAVPFAAAAIRKLSVSGRPPDNYC